MLPILGIAGWLAFFGDKSPARDAGVVTAVAPSKAMSPAQTTAVGSVTPAAPPAVSNAPLSSRQNIKLALQQESPLNPFVSPPPPPSASAVKDGVPPPPPPPNFVVIGSLLKNGQLSVFLDKDNQTYVATPGAVLDGNRVDAVRPDQVMLFNLSTKSTQIIPIEGEK
ncbi:MAG: hypothetical protein JWN23_1786 [Rhodocyclales bacterium]|nr:hypothetical protein [Rhodocyclales bacterium]